MLFDRFGWRGVAGATPRFMSLTGVPFFVGCILYNFFPGAIRALGPAVLKFLVYAGALLQVRLAAWFTRCMRNFYTQKSSLNTESAAFPVLNLS